MACYTNMMNRLKPTEDWTIYYLSVLPLWVKHFACNEKTAKNIYKIITSVCGKEQNM